MIVDPPFSHISDFLCVVDIMIMEGVIYTFKGLRKFLSNV